MQTLHTAWPAVVLLLPALVLVSAIVFLVKKDRRAFAFVMALLACYVIGAMLMEFFVFMSARMARAGTPASVAVLGNGTKQLLETVSNPRSLGAPPASLPAIATYAVLASYLWVLVGWGLLLRGKKGGGAKKKPAKATRKSAKAS